MARRLSRSLNTGRLLGVAIAVLFGFRFHRKRNLSRWRSVSRFKGPTSISRVESQGWIPSQLVEKLIMIFSFRINPALAGLHWMQLIQFLVGRISSSFFLENLDRLNQRDCLLRDLRQFRIIIPSGIISRHSTKIATACQKAENADQIIFSHFSPERRRVGTAPMMIAPRRRRSRRCLPRACSA